jgi:hypothetical protein
MLLVRLTDGTQCRKFCALKLRRISVILIGELLAGGFEMTSPISSGWCNAIVAATLEWKQVAGECSLGC